VPYIRNSSAALALIADRFGPPVSQVLREIDVASARNAWKGFPVAPHSKIRMAITSNMDITATDPLVISL